MKSKNKTKIRNKCIFSQLRTNNKRYILWLFGGILITVMVTTYTKTEKYFSDRQLIRYYTNNGCTLR